jgi:glycosyl transferase family 87
MTDNLAERSGSQVDRGIAIARRASFPRKSDIRAHATVLAVCLAVVALVDLSTPGRLDRAGQIKGTDFVEFYVFGSLVREGNVDRLYDPSTEQEASARLIPESKGMLYLPVYGPQVYLFFSPFARLPYRWALLAWTIVSALIYGVCCAVVWRTCPSLRADGSIVAIVAAAYPALFNLLLHGQNSALALAFLTGAYIALRAKRPFVAGLAVGMLIYKPQLGIVAAPVFVLGREWRVVVGAAVAAASQLAVAWAYFGTEVMKAYSKALLAINQVNDLLAVKQYQMHSLLEFWKLLIPSDAVAHSLYLLTALALIGVTVKAWRSGAPLSLRYSLLLLASALVSPHLYVYDLVILAPAFLLIADWTTAHSGDELATPVQRIIYLSYALPLTGVATKLTHLQLSVVAMSVLSVLVARAALRNPAPDSPAFAK